MQPRKPRASQAATAHATATHTKESSTALVEPDAPELHPQREQDNNHEASESSDVDMSGDDDDAMADQYCEVSLPKATIANMIQEKLPGDARMANTSKDLVMSLAVAFVQHLSSKAQQVCTDRNKKTIVAEHVFEAMHEAKLTYMMAPVLKTPNYGKLSFNKQRDLAMKKVQEADSQSKRLARHQQTQMTKEELLGEQERIFREARENMNQQEDLPMETNCQAEQPEEYRPGPIETMRDELMQVDFECAGTLSDQEQMFSFD